MDNKTLLICLAIFIVLVLLVILTIIQITEYRYNPIIKIEKLEDTQKVRESVPRESVPRESIPDHAIYQSSGILRSYNPNTSDIIRDYDYKKLYDPLEEPTRRITRHEIPPFHIKRLLDFPTRGYPDNFTQFGILVTEDKKSNNGDNNILRLFGRQEFPGSNRYEYYTGINSGSDQIKIPINIRGNELYDGDDVFIEELGKKYRVKLHKYDAPKYYPDIIY